MTSDLCQSQPLCLSASFTCRRGCAKDKQAVSRDVTCLPVSTNRSSPQTSLARLKAVGLCPPAIKPGLEKPKDSTQFTYFIYLTCSRLLLCNDSRHSLINIKILQQTLCIVSIHLSILFKHLKQNRYQI